MGDTSAVAWEQSTETADFSHLFTWKYRQPADPEGAKYVHARLLCHALIDLIPDEAMAEVLMELGNLSEQYEPLPPLRLLPSAPSRRVVKARIGRRYERPTFPIVEG